MKRSSVRILLGLALLSTGVAAYFAPPQAGEAVVLSERSVKAASPAASSGHEAPSALRPAMPARPDDVLGIKPREFGDERDGASAVFASTQWTPPPKPAQAEPAPPPASQPAPAPQAPPLPFRVLGRFSEDGHDGVFLQHNEQNLVVRVGDTIAEVYKVESFNGTTLTLRYAPLNQQQTLEVGGSN